MFGSGTYPYCYVANAFGNYTSLPTTFAGCSTSTQVSQYVELTTTPVTSANRPLSVTTPPPSLVSAYLTASSNSMIVGNTMQMAAKCHYSSGPDQDCTVADIYGDAVNMWASNTPADATVNSSGLVTAVSSSALCSGVGNVCTPVSTPPVASMVSITSFGCMAGGGDCTSGINSAISSARSAGKAIYVPCGTFTVSAFSDNGVSIYGAGSCSVLYAPAATNAMITMSGNNWILANFTHQIVSTARDFSNFNVWISPGSDGWRIDSTILNGGNAGGIFDRGGTNGIITNNTVENTLADGIHNTYGAANIIVANNSVLNTGDDGLANVSYTSDPAPVTNVLEQNNSVNGVTPTGRGGSVIGGQNVTFQGNTIQNVACCSGIEFGEENTGSNTQGVSNAVAKNNILSHNSGASGTPDLLAYAGAGTVTDILFQGNSTTSATHDAMGIQAGAGFGGAVSNVAFVNNAAATPGGGAITGTGGSNIYCSGNTLNGSPTSGSPGVCTGSNTFTPTGSSLVWTGNLSGTGAVSITATIGPSGIISTAYPVTVTNPAVTLTGISLSTAGGVTGLFVGATNQLKATCSYSDGSSDDCTATDAHGNLAHSYVSTAPAHATVNATSGLVTGVALGSTTFTAVAGSFTSNPLPLAVFPVLSGIYTITVRGPVKFSGTVRF
jgi:hypothetical protein